MTDVVNGSFRAGHPILTFLVRGTNQQIARIEAMIDTGFNDYLTLPSWVIEKLQLLFVEENQYFLADGTEGTAKVFEAEVEWFGSWRKTLVTQVDQNVLVGTALMQGCKLVVEVIDGGRVELSRLNIS